MEIKTKFNLGDLVWVMHNNRPRQDTIVSISVECEIMRRNVPDIEYSLAIGPIRGGSNGVDCFISQDNVTFSEENVFATKEELVEYLLKK